MTVASDSPVELDSMVEVSSGSSNSFVILRCCCCKKGHDCWDKKRNKDDRIEEVKAAIIRVTNKR